MQGLLSEAGRSFLRAFAASLIVLAPGILAAPNLNRGVAVGIAAVMASIAAGLKAIQVFIPQLSLSKWLPEPFGESAVVGALVGAFAAGIRVVQGSLTQDEAPARNFGLPRLALARAQEVPVGQTQGAQAGETPAGTVAGMSGTGA